MHEVDSPEHGKSRSFLDLPPWPTLFAAEITRSYPLNSSPYIATLGGLARSYASCSRRRELLSSVASFVTSMQQDGASPVCLLLGGSFCDPGIRYPKDLDGLMIFESGEAQADFENLIIIWRNRSEGLALDLRFVPLDVDPIWLVKVACFMSAVYSRDKQSPAANRGCWLIDLRNENDGPEAEAQRPRAI